MNAPKRIKTIRRAAESPSTALVPASGALVAMPAPGEGLDRADRVNFFHRLSREAGIVAIRAAIAAGVELLEAKAEHAGGFQNWVKSKCAFGLSTAYNYMAVAEKTLTEARLPALLEGTDADRENAIEEAATSTDSRTLTDLYEGLGIVKRTPSKMGGARPGAGRPKLIPEDGVTEGIRKAAVAKWGEVQRNVGQFLAHKFELALTMQEVRAAEKTVQALQDALAQRIAELEKRP